jgi:acetolactate synthase-1/2/3 large subunit
MSEETDINRLCLKLLKSQNPVIIVGGGSVFSNAGKKILQLSEKLAIPVATTYVVKGIIPENHPLSLGILFSNPAKEIINNSDLVIALGCYSLHFSPIELPNNLKLIQVDNDPSKKGLIFKNVKDRDFILGDINHVLYQVLMKCDIKNKVLLNKYE